MHQKHFHVFLGENDRNKPENEEQQFRVRPGGIIVHERYSRMKSTRHDIALLRLEGKAEVTDYVNTVSACFGLLL